MRNWTQSQADAIQARNRPKSSPDSIPEAFEGREAQLHDLCLAEARRRRFYVVHSRTDQRTTQQKGIPDLILAIPDGKTLWIELKVGKNKLTVEQEAAGVALKALGHDFSECRSFDEFLKVIQ